jgi:hypothetical protein
MKREKKLSKEGRVAARDVMSNQEELEALHARVVQFVETHMRSPANPAIHARALVHSKSGITHLIVPLSGVNELGWSAPLAESLEKAFPPDGYMRTRALPDASQIVYEMVIPLSAGFTGRHRSKHRSSSSGGVVEPTAPGGAGGGLLDNPLVLLLGLALAFGLGWVFLLSPALGK